MYQKITELQHKNVELAASINALLATSSRNGIKQLKAKTKRLGSKIFWQESRTQVKSEDFAQENELMKSRLHIKVESLEAEKATQHLKVN